MATNQSANNASGFGALPAGYCYYDGSGYYYGSGSDAVFWSATEGASEHAYYRSLGYGNATLTRHSYPKDDGYSVRCLCD